MTNLDSVRRHCIAMPHATEEVLFGDNLVFKIGGKMFAIAASVPSTPVLSFKTSPEEFNELCERPNIIPAPYLARAYWVALEGWDALSRVELKHRLTVAYELAKVSLPKKVQAGLE